MNKTIECNDHEPTVSEYEIDTMTNGEHDTYTVQVYKCRVCGADLSGDPVKDQAEEAGSREDS